jgi:4-hydroxybenzoate polyprenyltransferase
MKNRWWIYQQERFPIFKHGLLIAIFSLSAVSYSLLLRDPLGTRSLLQSPGAPLIAFVMLFLFFLQLRVADEFKDHKEDCRYRPYRPVPRGLIELWELGMVAIGAAVIQLGLAFSMGMPLVWLLLAVWAYMGLMTREFFVPRWLKAHPVVYLLSHSIVMPMLAFYGTACDWLAAGNSPSPEIVRFLLVSWFGGIVLEIGRKIRIPKDEEAGVETYSSLWGHQRAAMVWLGAIGLLTIAVIAAALPINFLIPVTAALIILLTLAVITTWQFLYRPIRAKAAGFEEISALWTVGVYLIVGIVPLLLREFTNVG